MALDHVYMLGGVTCHMLPHLSGVPHLHVNRLLKSKSQRVSSNCYKSSNNLVKNNINLSFDRNQTNQRGTNYSQCFLTSDKTFHTSLSLSFSCEIKNIDGFKKNTISNLNTLCNATLFKEVQPKLTPS